MKLDVPILSIDYSLCPEAPFPRALEEVFFAYCWALKNAECLGWTGEKIVFAGDSAGGNLVTAACIKCIELGISKPDGLFVAYGTFIVNFVVTPSRFMGLFDTFLSAGTIIKVMKSYGGGAPLHSTSQDVSSDSKSSVSSEIPELAAEEFMFEISKHYLLSPYWAPDDILREFPPTRILTMSPDPCIDECVDFSKKLRRLNVDVHLDILDAKLAHGFLIMTQVRSQF